MATGAISASAASSLSPRKTVAYQGMWTTPAAMSGSHLRPDRARAVRCLALPLGRRADEDRHLAEVPVLVHELVGLGDLLEAHGPPEYGTDLALLDQLVRAVALPRVREVRADDPLLAHPQVADVEVERVAGRRAADDDGAERLDGEHRGREGGPPDMLEDDVGLAAELLDHRLAEAPRLLEARLLLLGRLVAAAHHPRELVAVDVVARAQRPHELALPGRAHHTERLRARQPAELVGEHAEAAPAAPDQHAVALLQLGLVDEHAIGGEVGQPVGGGLLPGQRLGLGQQLLGLDLAELRERAPGRLVAPDALRRRRERVEPVDLDVLVGGLVAVDDHLVAGVPARDALAHLPDDAGGVRAADVVSVLGVVAVAPHPDRLAEGRPHVVVV